MPSTDLIVIGAGVAGLAAGCYARRNGYHVRVFESHGLPGGMCTSWRRKEFVFDFCIHNLSGTGPGSGLSRVWSELGALKGVRVMNPEIFVRLEDPSGKALSWYTDLDRLRDHLVAIAFEDRGPVDDMIRAARRLMGADLFAADMGGFVRTLKILPRLLVLKRWSDVTMSAFAERFRNPLLRRLFPHLLYDIPGAEVPMIAPLLFMAGLDRGDLGWPEGGSLAFSKRIEQHLIEMGGSVQYHCRVKEILTDKDRAVGVRLEDGTEHRAARVVSACDGRSTVEELLGNRYTNDIIRSYYSEPFDTSPFGFFVHLGLKAEIEGAPHALTILFDDALDLNGVSQDSLHVTYFDSTSGLAPRGKSILKIETQAHYPFWARLRKEDHNAYSTEKTNLAKRLLERLEIRFPGLFGLVEVMDAATLVTTERFTGNFHGAQPGPPRSHASEIRRNGLSRTLPGLRGFYMTGQWAAAQLGISSVAVESRNLVKRLCKEDGKRFIT